MSGLYEAARGISRVGIYLTAICLAAALPAQAQQDESLVARGKYLTTAGDCMACHTKPGGQPYGGGRAIATPFGSIASPNITADPETGIGTWSDENFYQAVHNGVGKDGEYLYPVFPFTSYTKVNREDVLAIKAYLFSLTPVHAPRENNSLTFPYNIRSSLAVWRQLFFRAGEFKPDLAKSPEINHGAYLVQGLEHCGECHTRRNRLGGAVNGRDLQGAEVQGWYAPNITSDWASGIGSWSDDELFAYLKTGITQGKGVVAGPMSEVVHESLSQLPDSDIRDVVAYLKSTPPVSTETVTAGEVKFDVSAPGAGLYLDNCASCHQLDGEGIKGRIPPLAKNGSVTAEGPDNILKAILGGLSASGDFGPMPSFGASLTDGDIVQISNYVRTTWGNKAAANATESLVAKSRKDTNVMLALGEGDALCPTALQAKEKAVADKAGAGLGPLLAGLTRENLNERVPEIATAIKAIAPADASTSDLVNGLSAAYCPSVERLSGLAGVEKRRYLDKFGQLLYTQLTGVNVAGANPIPAANATQ